MEYANLADHQAGPRKRQRTSYGANDAQRGRASRQLDDFDLFEARMRSVKHLQSTFEDIIQRYGKDFPEDDEIDLRTGDITVNNGHIARLHQAEFGDGFGGYEESESDSSGHLDVEDRIQPGRLRGIRSMICPMDPPWSSSGFQDITSLRSKNSAQSQHTTAAYTRKRNHRRHSYPGDSVVFTRRRVFFSPEEIKLLVMLKRDNASWDEVYRALPHRPTLSIRQWYRKLEYKDEVPEEWLPRDQEILESLVTSNAEMFWEDLFERFNRVSHRKLKNLWLNTCLSMAGLQPSQCWRWLPNHGPGGEQGEMAVNPQQTVRSPEVIELLSSPVSHAGIERGGPEQTVDDEGSVGPVLYPDPAEDYYNNQQHSPPRSSNGDHFQILLSPGPINRNASASLENRGSFTGYLPISDKQLLADHPHPTDSGEHDTSFSIQQKGDSSTENTDDYANNESSMLQTPNMAEELPTITPATASIQRKKGGRPKKSSIMQPSSPGSQTTQSGEPDHYIETSQMRRFKIEWPMDTTQARRRERERRPDETQQKSTGRLSEEIHDINHDGEIVLLDTPSPDTDDARFISESAKEVTQPRKRRRLREVELEEHASAEQLAIQIDGAMHDLGIEMEESVITPAADVKQARTRTGSRKVNDWRQPSPEHLTYRVSEPCQDAEATIETLSSKGDMMRSSAESKNEVKQPRKRGRSRRISEWQRPSTRLFTGHSDTAQRDIDATSPKETSSSTVDVVSPIAEPIAGVEQPRRPGRSRKVPNKQQDPDDDRETLDQTVSTVTPARARSKSPSSISTRSRSIRRSSVPKPTPEGSGKRSGERTHPTNISTIKRTRFAQIKAPESQIAQHSGSGDIPFTDQGKQPRPRRNSSGATTKSTPVQSLTPKTLMQDAEDSDSDDPLSTPFTTIRPAYRKLSTYAGSPLAQLLPKRAKKRHTLG